MMFKWPLAILLINVVHISAKPEVHNSSMWGRGGEGKNLGFDIL